MVIPNTIDSIDTYAFCNCSSLTSVTIGNSVTYIDEYAFKWCNNITHVTLNSNAIVSKKHNYQNNIHNMFGLKVTHYIIGDDVTSIGDYAFYNLDYYSGGSSSLATITIGENVTSIGEAAFFDCDSLSSIAIPNSVTSIGNYAFAECDSLNSITIPNNIKSIGKQAFRSCSSLTTVLCEATYVPETEADAFNGSNILTDDPRPTSYATLYVPKASLDKYKSTEPWKYFAQILPIEKAPSAVENIPSSMINSPKILRNGQILIIRDGKTYNVMGQEL